jgi:OmpA-OmpF porin, OOP family
VLFDYPRSAVSLLVAATALLSCATPIRPSSMVEAERAFEDASSDPRVSDNAPVYLYEAKKAIDQAEQVWRDDADDPRVDHLAYLAHKRVEIAREIATKRRADAESQALARQRDKLVLEARTRQVDVARIEADQAQKREEEARARTAELEQQLAELEAKKTERGMVITLGDVLFDFGRAELQTGAQNNLYRLVSFLRDNPDREVVIEGYTDSVGDEAYNLDLSQRRAHAVRAFLSQNGVDPARTAARGFGEARPVASNGTDAGRQQNRRVEIVILDAGRRAAEEIGR